MPLLETCQLTCVFDNGNTAFENISLSIEPGDFIILAGPNGSGKTTFLRHLNGLLKGSSGRVLLNGDNIFKDLIQTRKTIGMVFQDPDTQIVADTVFDEAAFGPRNLKIPEKQVSEIVTAQLEQMGLSHLKDTHPATLSGGEKRRLAIAGILAMKSQILLLDEPFSNLDFKSAQSVHQALEHLKTSGHTIVTATHDLEPVLHLATRLIIMGNGTIQKDGLPADLAPELEQYGIQAPCPVRFNMGVLPWPW